MQVLIAGASGFLGSHLVTELRGRGHDVTRLVRRRAEAPDEVQWDPVVGEVDPATVEAADVVVNVAGAPTVGNPHSKKWQQALRESRVQTTGTLARAVADATRRPVFLAGNAVGWYGDHGGEPVPETAASHGDSLMTSVCRDWQDAASPAVDAGARVCFLRTAPVMDRSASPLRELRRVFRLGLGAKLGDGRQYFPMVSLRDWLAGVTFLAEHDSVSGPVNLACPETPTNAEFTEALAAVVGRKALLRAPAAVISAAAGELSNELLGSMRIQPQVLLEAGFEFQDADVRQVLVAALA
ncbi:MAG TPA: TIGR01777 family oxidoreductase [Nocardioides sp.]|nr:TIGR01777 family oxidoreductase [Nocardioides sp.]